MQSAQSTLGLTCVWGSGGAAGRVKLVREDGGEPGKKELIGGVVWMKHDDLPVILDTVPSCSQPPESPLSSSALSVYLYHCACKTINCSMYAYGRCGLIEKGS